LFFLALWRLAPGAFSQAVDPNSTPATPGASSYIAPGALFAAGHAAIINALGRIDAAQGSPTWCLLVNGTSTACAAGAATWGGIVGTLANQTDLAAALTAKLNASGFTQAAAAALWTGSGCGNGANALLVGGTCGAIGGGGSATWGGIGGTLANQTDLAAALTAKLNASSFTQAAAAALWTGSGCGTGTNALLVNGNCGASGGGSAVMASQLLDFAVTVTSIAVETMCASCSSTTPGILYVGVVPFIATVPVTVGISGTVTSGTVYWYLSSLQVLTAGHNSAATLTGSAGIAVATGVTGFPVDSVPLWVSTFAANNWDSTNEGTMDKRPFLGRTVIAVGPGMASSSDPSTGVQTLSTDPLTSARFFTGSGAPSGNCTAGRDFYTSAVPHLYWCSAANTWTLVI